MSEYPCDEFGPVFPSLEKCSEYFGKLMLNDPPLAERLRHQQILRESLELALTSKKRGTAQSRMELARSKVELLRANYEIPDAEWTALEQRFNKDSLRFKTIQPINEATGHLDHARKLKTAKSKAKYVHQAREAITAALNDPQADREALSRFLDELESDL